ncbi:MAG: Pseudogene of DNA methylase [Methanobrevibacter sp. CfCl-M3]
MLEKLLVKNRSYHIPIEEYYVNNKKIYSIGFGTLLICFDDEITSEIAIEIIKLKENLSSETIRVVFKR